MSLINKFLGWIKNEPTDNVPDIRFGRYSDAYKTKQQYEAWDKAISHFDKKEYLESYRAFFDYLNDPKLNNVVVKEEEGVLHFAITQGSKIINGTASSEKVIAETNVAKCERLNVGFMRRLVEMNYGLLYSRFALLDDVICLKFDTSVLDGSPDKLYFALKEVAVKADKHDDLLLNEFSMLKPINHDHIEDLPETEKAIKFKYLHKWINEANDLVRSLDQNKYAAAIAHILLSVAYKIDYLIAPEGSLMDKIEKIHQAFYAQDKSSIIQRNVKIQTILAEILKFDQAKIYEELYNTKATFGFNAVKTPAFIHELMGEELKSVEWHLEQKDQKILPYLLEYIPVHSNFYYGLPKPTKLLFQLIISLLNADYFEALGFSKTYYDTENNKLEEGQIKQKLKSIQKEAVTKYPHFNLEFNKLKWDNRTQFSFSLLKHMTELNYSKN
ncbi:MAG: hypothetical protein ACPGXL_00370 [Chitinophagales bacterium]